jgi:hypothetical protein
MFSHIDVNLAFSGLFCILAILNLTFLVWGFIRIKHLIFIRQTNRILWSLYLLLPIYNGIRLICFSLSIFHLNSSINKNDLDYYRKLHFLLLNGPEIIIWILLFVFFWAFLNLLYSSHLDLRLENMKKSNASKWFSSLVCIFIIASFLITKLFIVYFYIIDEINEAKYQIGDSILFLCLTLAILIREIFIHRTFSGLPYKSIQTKRTKRNVNLKIIFWLVSRVLHCLVTLLLLLSNHLASYIKRIDLEKLYVTNYDYYMILCSAIIIFLDQLLFELFPIYCILDIKTFKIFIKSSKNLQLLLEEDSDDDDVKHDNNHNKSSSVTFSSEQELHKFFLSDFRIDLKEITYKNAFGRLIFHGINPIDNQNGEKNGKLCLRVFKFQKMSHFLRESVLNDMNKHIILQRQEDLNIANLIGFSKEDEYFIIATEYYSYGYKKYGF